MINIPSTTTLYNRVLTALETTFSVTLPTWGKNFLRGLSLVLGREFRLLYIGIASLQKNLWIDNCDDDMVLRFGFVKLGRYPLPATEGTYTCTVTGTSGATIPGQTTFKSDDSSESPGYLFILDSPFTLTGTSGTITLRAFTAGTVSRLAVGNTLTSTSPLLNVDSVATVGTVVTSPNDAEAIEQYRAKVIQSFQLLPSGDNAVSYREEGSIDISGVQQIYPYATSGAPNEIDIYIEAIAADSTDGKGTPTATIISNVTAAIEANRPLGVHDIHYYAIGLKQVDINVNMSGYTTFTSAQKDLILTSIQLLISQLRPFIAAADTVASRKDSIGAFNIGPAIAAAVPGVPFGAVTFKIDGVTQTNYQFDLGQIPWLNSVSYV